MSLADRLEELAGKERELCRRFKSDRDCLTEWIDAMAALSGEIRENIPTIIAALRKDQP